MTELLERASEAAALAAMIDVARDGRGGLVVVEGPAGIGKTSLLGLGRGHAEATGMRVLEARGTELERDLPFGVVRRLLERPLRDADPPLRERLLAGAAARSGPLLLGEVTAPPPGTDAGTELVSSLYWLLTALAEQCPVLLLIDDLHWADARSLDLLAFLAPRAGDLPLLIVGATRPPEADAHPMLLDARSQTVRLHPAPLSDEAVAALLEAGLGTPADPAFVAACRDVTGGNPFYLGELLHELVADEVPPTAAAAPRVEELGPQTVARAVFARIAGAPPAAIALTRALVVLGDDTELRHVAALGGLTPAEAAESAGVLARAGVLADARPLRFAHPILRAAISADLAAAERAQLHAQAARLLADASADRAAQHLLLTDPVGEPWAVDVLQTAAVAARATGAPATAAAYLRRALREPDGDGHAEILRELGAAEFVAGEAAALGHLEEALAAAEDPAERALVARELAGPQLMAGRVREALDVLAEAAAALGPEDSGLAMELYAARSGLAIIHAESAPAVMEPLRRFETAPGTAPAERVLLANLAYWRASTGADAEEAALLAERSVSGGLLDDTASPAVVCAMFVLIAAERFALVDATLEDALEGARHRASAVAFMIVSGLRSLAAYRRGDLDAAEAEAEAAVLSARDHGWEQGFPVAVPLLAAALVDRGSVDEARKLLATETAPGELGERLFGAQLLVARGRLAIATGDTRAGVDDLLAAGRLLEHGRSIGIAGFPTFRSSAAPALAALGEEGEARRLADEELALARAWGAPIGLGSARRVAGVVAGGHEGVVLLEEAVATLAPTAARLELARAQLSLGEALRRAGRSAEARTPLREAARLAHACGAAALTARAEAELAASGARRVKRALLSGSDALTPNERRIASMAAEGLSNREIAQALFLTTKTVEAHLTNSYRKLGIEGRAHLADALDVKRP